MTTTLTPRARRIKNLAALAQRHWVDPSADTPAANDLHEALTGRLPCHRFALVSFSPDLGATRSVYINTSHETFTGASEAGASMLGASAPLEVPLEIVNLDTGDVWVPDFSQTAWKITETPQSQSEANLMKVDKRQTDYQPLAGVTADRFSTLYPIHEEIRKHGFQSVTLDLIVHTDAAFAEAFNKIAARYRAGVPISGLRMRRIVAQAAELARDRTPDQS